MTSDDEALLARLPAEAHATNGVPSSDDAHRREQAAMLAAKHVAPYLVSDGIRVSPLGPGWSSDIDLHVRRIPPDGELLALGWLPLDALLRSIGSRGSGRWAVVDGHDGTVLAGADLHTSPPPDPVACVLDRCLRRREVRVREVLELRVLRRTGRRFPARHRALTAAADIEAGLGFGELARWRSGTTRDAPTPLTHRRWAIPLGTARRTLRPNFVVACSGVDGAGKSGLARGLVDDLQRAGVPASLVWTRPGLRLGPLDALARAAKRMLRTNLEPGVRAMARGSAAPLPSRRGPLGWIWAVLITVAFFVDVRRQHVAARGVVVYDRHLLDALATLEFAYDGVDLRVPRALVARALPKADVTVLLDVPPDVAVDRKPGDVIGDHAVRRQLESYEAHVPLVKRLYRLDATSPRPELAAAAFRIVVAGSCRRT